MDVLNDAEVRMQKAIENFKENLKNQHLEQYIDNFCEIEIKEKKKGGNSCSHRNHIQPVMIDLRKLATEILNGLDLDAPMRG